MKVIHEYTTIDKSSWGPGPWQDEPDKQQLLDEATDYDVLIVRVPHSGHLCGYIGLPEGHPAYGLDYDQASALGKPDEDGYRSLRVHGGPTFSGFCQKDAEEDGICHVPLEGRPAKVFWLGFDAIHSGDFGPATSAHYGWEKHPWEEYRTLEYMLAECADLARQLKEIEERR